MERMEAGLKDRVNRLVDEGDYEAALAALDAAGGAATGYLRFKRSVCCVRLGKWGDAIAEARAAAEEDPTLEDECAWIVAEALRRVGRAVEAERAYLRLAAESSTDERRRTAKGLAALAREERDDWKGAAILYREILAADPFDVEAAFRLAYCLERADDLPAAAEAWRAFLGDHADEPEAPKARFRLGMVLHRLERYDEAAAAFDGAAAEAEAAEGETFLATISRQMAERARARRSAMERGTRAYDPRQ
jgi:tetratricopeptide (TPR) repeat protein